MWFSNDGSGRFDLLRGDAGTCYFAERPVGAFVEVFRTATVIAEAAVRVRSLALLRPPAPTTLADCTASDARGFGVTAAIQSQPDYDLTRAWAQAFADAGFGGILYTLSHDPSGAETGVALFGSAGEQSLPVDGTEPIPACVLDEARARFSLVVLPTPV